MQVDNPDAVRAAMEEQYGRAARFVVRAMNARQRSFVYYSSSPAQTLRLVLDHIERVGAIQPPFITPAQKEAAQAALWDQYWAVSELDVKELARNAERRPMTPEYPVGNGWDVSVVASAVNQDGCYRAAPAGDPDSGYRHATMAGAMPVDDRYGMRDPALELSRYRMRPRVIHLTPREDARFELNHQRHIMDNLRNLERRLWPETRRAARHGSGLR